LVLGFLLVPFVLFTHRANISRLVSGTENKFGQKKQQGEEV
jgi:glycerol-3-phosphate acyltransferase PlsY